MGKVTLEAEPKPFGIKCNGQSITGVTASSQAEKAGVKIGWKVLKIAGSVVSTAAEVSKALAVGKKAGKKYKIVFETPDEDNSAAGVKTAAGSNPGGSEGKIIIEAQPKAFGVKCNGQSVTAVTAGSQAEQNGVKVGWKILEIAGKKVGLANHACLQFD
jgi:predicted metalloprotease with PDZ domain